MNLMGLDAELSHPGLGRSAAYSADQDGTACGPQVRSPAPRAHALPRRRSGRRLILFRAPAGYGKTMLAAEWSQRLREGGALVAWLSLDSDDNEPGAFAYHLARAFESAGSNLGHEAIELLQASSLIPARNVMSSLLNAVSEVDSEIVPLPRRFPRRRRRALPRADEAACSAMRRPTCTWCWSRARSRGSPCRACGSRTSWSRSTRRS